MFLRTPPSGGDVFKPTAPSAVHACNSLQSVDVLEFASKVDHGTSLSKPMRTGPLSQHRCSSVLLVGFGGPSRGLGGLVLSIQGVVTRHLLLQEIHESGSL